MTVSRHPAVARGGVERLAQPRDRDVKALDRGLTLVPHVAGEPLTRHRLVGVQEEVRENGELHPHQVDPERAVVQLDWTQDAKLEHEGTAAARTYQSACAQGKQR